MQEEKFQSIKIKEKHLIPLFAITNQVSVSHIKNYNEIENALKLRIKDNNFEKSYKEKYIKIINESKKTISDFKNNFQRLYIIDLINRLLKKDSICISENADFQNIILGLFRGLKTGVIPNNIVQAIINFDDSKLIEKLRDQKVKIVLDPDINNIEKLYIKPIIDEINDYSKNYEKIYFKN